MCTCNEVVTAVVQHLIGGDPLALMFLPSAHLRVTWTQPMLRCIDGSYLVQLTALSSTVWVIYVKP